MDIGKTLEYKIEKIFRIKNLNLKKRKMIKNYNNDNLI
jgi:hypothetical protein